MDNIAQVCLCSWDSNMQEIPSSDSFGSPLKNGYLYKLIGKGWLYSGTWKARYCVLDGSKFYFYENEQSKGHEKSCGVINLDYYDLCEEDTVKDKKQPYVFIIGTSVRGFFDNRQQFAAESKDEMQSWIRAIQSAIAEARISRRKPGRKQRQQEGKSPDLSTSSQESEGTSTACLVNVAKDRAKGPQGRRLPQRKSMMPTTRSAEENDLRQRSTSLSTPPTNGIEEEPSFPKTTSEAKWISLSMEEMDREKNAEVTSQRSSSTYDITQQASETENGDVSKSKRVGPRFGVNLLGQHAALTRELEMKLKAGMTPGARRPPSPDEDDEVYQRKKEAKEDKKMEFLRTKVDLTKDTLNALEERVSELTSQVEATTEKSEQAKSQVGDVLLQVTVTLKEAERINEECKRALTEANRARSEYQLLVKECKETLAKLHGERDS